MQTRSRLEHLSRLSTSHAASCTRQTSIVCTIGPSCASAEKIREMIEAGMTLARVSTSHGTHEEHREIIQRIREVRKDFPDVYVAIALDTRGPEIRTGPVKSPDGVDLVSGSTVKLLADETNTEECTSDVIFMTYGKAVSSDLKVNDVIFIDSGQISVKVVERNEGSLTCIVENGGRLYSRKSVNLPSCHIDLPILSEKDKDSLRLAIEERVDMVFASYVRCGDDVAGVKRVLAELGSPEKEILVIGKIENQPGVDKIDEIIEAADGILIARGKLGVEAEVNRVTLIQKEIIAKCICAGRPVIVATQMLESMRVHPRATRAECSDVANAVLDGTDCVMLSEETAVGKYPVQAVAFMDKICCESEAANFHRSPLPVPRSSEHDECRLETLAATAATTVCMFNATVIVLASRTGRLAQQCSRFRPPVPIVALCRSPRLARQLQLFRGVLPFHNDRVVFPHDSALAVEETLRIAVETGKRRGFIQKGDALVYVTGWPKEEGGRHSMLQLVIAE